MDEFVNTHVHSMYSIQDSIIKTDELCKLVYDFGQKACCITDHGSTAGWYDFNENCKKYGIKPIFGEEFYCIDTYANKTRERDHLVMLAMDTPALMEINYLQRISVENQYYKPILSYEVLKEKECIENIICTSACSLGKISKEILKGNIKNAECTAEQFATLFNDNFYLELQFHPDYKEQAIINDNIINIAEDFGIELSVATDAHFLTQDDKEIRKIIQAISWHKDYEELADSLSSNCLGNTKIVLENAELSGFDDLSLVKKAIHNTSKIADRCDAHFGDYDRLIPQSQDKLDELEKLFDEVEW